ncbi:MAG TPA: hypothetical protein DCR44_05915 [Acholeplasmatales bacterium]|nr:hypothetical protein [Acholeplasmatales bacterium]
MMKRITSCLVIALIWIGLFGCHSVDSNENYYSLELINFSDFLIEPLASQYQAGMLVEVTTAIIYDADLVLYLNNEKITQTWSDVPFWKYEFTMPGMDSILEFKVEAITQVEIDIHDYIDLPNVTAPFDYFDCEMIEVIRADFYDLSTVTSMIGDYNSYDYEYGNLVNADLGSTSIYQSELILNKAENDSVFQTESLIYRENTNGIITTESYQYQQKEDLIGYILNQTDGDFSGGKYTMEHIDYNSIAVYYDLKPGRLVLLTRELDSVIYKMGSKNDSTFVSISGMFNDYPNRLEYYNVSCEMIYVIQNNEIVAWLYTETLTGPEVEGSWETIYYCIPFDGEIPLIDQEILDHFE